MPRVESRHKDTWHPLEILGKIHQGWLLQSASLLSARMTSRPSWKCYILFDAGWYRERRIETWVIDKTWYRANGAELRVWSKLTSLSSIFVSVMASVFHTIPPPNFSGSMKRVPLLEDSPSCVSALLSSWACCKNLTRPLCFPDFPVHQNHLRVVKYTYFQALLPRDSNSGRWGLGDF